MKKYISAILIAVFLISSAFVLPAASAKTNFKVSATATTNSVKLKWNKVKGAKHYKIYRKTANTKYKLVCKKTTKRTFTNKKLKANKKYTYKVKAFKKNKKGKFYSFDSAVKSVRTKKAQQPTTTTTTVLTPSTTTEIPTTQTTTTTSFDEQLKKLQAHYSNLSNEEKLNMFEKDFGHEISETAEVVELELTSYAAYVEGAWGYFAKIKLDDADYFGLYDEFYHHNIVVNGGFYSKIEDSATEMDINEIVQSTVEYFAQRGVSFNNFVDWWQLTEDEVNMGRWWPKGQILYNTRPGISFSKMQINYYSFLVQDNNNEKYLYINTPMADDFVTYFNEKH